ncbi:uncharacterized protein involved in response to NO [Janthinobacterium sp. CG_23.3]|uniref:NnrS family protein n=1 Tax=Janthinobacterium sp. CG_23.3 TaxID=3349634 RepID=UPI0038D48BF8
MSLLSIDEPGGGKRAALWQGGHAVWRLGFRPFYLMAALFAALAVPLWIVQYLGWLRGWPRVGLGWHMHEMVFGMAVAVVVGFLFTAARAWTGVWTPRGGHLAALAALWLAARVALLVAPGAPAAVVDIAFLPLCAWPLYRVLAQSGNKRNVFLAVLLGLLAIANCLYHAAALGLLALAPTVPVQAAILLIVVIEAVIGGRVIPMFTRNGAPGANAVANPRRDVAAMVLLVAASLAWVAGAPAPLSATLALAAASASLVRLAGWQPQRTLGVPLLWIMHLSYGWIPIGFALLGGAALNLVSASAAFHALTVGSMAGLIIGMMTRTTLGHTGRALKAGRAETAMFWLIQLGAVARLLAGVGPAAWYDTALVAAALCWTLAFGLYALTYGPYLLRPRIDGKEG